MRLNSEEDLAKLLYANPDLARRNYIIPEAPQGQRKGIDALAGSLLPSAPVKPSKKKGHPHEDFRRQVVDIARLLGYKCYWTWRSHHSPKGDLDLRLIKPPRLIWAELKVPPDKLTSEQRECFDLLEQCGQEVYVWTPAEFDDIVAILRGSLGITL